RSENRLFWGVFRTPVLYTYIVKGKIPFFHKTIHACLNAGIYCVWHFAAPACQGCLSMADIL
ncbi:MAG: hypothetical protein K2O59_01605, partial [Lachnospiraceae bacterium]|nr:hypothetical protein [Lachnospiraceae bacterium]